MEKYFDTLDFVYFCWKRHYSGEDLAARMRQALHVKHDARAEAGSSDCGVTNVEFSRYECG